MATAVIQPWMLGTLLLLLATVCWTIVRVIKDTRRRQREADEFLEMVNDSMSLRPNPEAVALYTSKKRAIFDQLRQQHNWQPERYEEDALGPPEDAWQREVPKDQLTALKTALIKRAMALVPLINPCQQEVKSRYNLLQRGLIDEKLWNKTVSLNQAIVRELTEIRNEAEALEENYGVQHGIIRDAQRFFELETVKARREFVLQEFIKMAIAQGVDPKDAPRVATERLAAQERMMAAQAANRGRMMAAAEQQQQQQQPQQQGAKKQKAEAVVEGATTNISGERNQEEEGAVEAETSVTSGSTPGGVVGLQQQAAAAAVGGSKVAGGGRKKQRRKSR